MCARSLPVVHQIFSLNPSYFMWTEGMPAGPWDSWKISMCAIKSFLPSVLREISKLDESGNGTSCVASVISEIFVFKMRRIIFQHFFITHLSGASARSSNFPVPYPGSLCPSAEVAQPMYIKMIATKGPVQNPYGEAPASWLHQISEATSVSLLKNAKAFHLNMVDGWVVRPEVGYCRVQYQLKIYTYLRY